MNYNDFMKTLFKSPMAITSYVLVSTIVFFQFVALFLGRWIDLVEFASMVLLVVTMWLLFAGAINKKAPLKKNTPLTCTFAWLIVKLVSLCLGALLLVISGVYVIVISGNVWRRDMTLAIAGVFIMLFGAVIYADRIIINILAVKEIVNIRKSPVVVYELNEKWFAGSIILAGLRGGSLLLQYIVALLFSSSIGDYYDYFDEFDWFFGIIVKSLRAGSNICLTVIDGCYIALFILTALLVKKYCKAVNYSRYCRKSG